MLSQLYIENIAVIEKAAIDFQAGLNVLTGETGAGKSMVIDAINAVLGERTSREIVRTGAKSALASAMFTDLTQAMADKLEELGFQPEEDGLLIQREIGADGKSVCKINGRPATVSMLKELGAGLINIHGQHDSYDLLSPDLHIRYIDRMGVPESLLKEYQAAFERMHAIRRELDSFNMDEAQKARQMDLLSYQISELESADLRAGEQEELTRQKTMYVNAEKIALQLERARLALEGGEDALGAAEAVELAADALESAARYLPEMQALSQRLRGLGYELEDCRESLRDSTSQVESDPQVLEQVEERLDQLYRLGLKYGGSEEEMLAFLERCRDELEKIQLSDENTARLTKELAAARTRAEKLADEISQKRGGIAGRFTELVTAELAFLNMPNIRFVVEQEHCPLNALGCDKVQFLISTNPGEPPKPISKIASGGELSRIMLAIKTVLAGRDSVDTLIFDEVDTGVSGGAAQKVGLKLKQVSHDRQVLCVTHLAQIAALAGSHFLIQKHVEGNRTFTNVTPLDSEGRKRELARIMGGEEITPLMLQNAAEMLEMGAKA